MSDRWQSLPNILSGLRLVLGVPIALAILQRATGIALLLLLLACVTDILDGWLARRFGWQTRLGAFLDPAADKILMGLTFMVLAWSSHVAVWLAVLVVVRDLVIAGGALAYRVRFGPFDHAATWLGKASTLVQMALVVVVVARLDGRAWLAGLLGRADLLGYVASFLTVLVVIVALCSALDYVWTWSRRALRDAALRSETGH